MRPVIIEMDKNHVKSFKKMFNSYNSRKKELTRLENKMKKTRKNLPDIQYKKEQKIREIDQECKNMEEEERRQIAAISNLEYDLYKTLGSGISEIVKKELNIFELNFDIARELLKFTDVVESSSEFNEDEVLVEHGEYDGLVRVTPPTSPSIRGGGLMRRMGGSMMSLTSIMDEGLNKVRKKSKPDDKIILSELSEMLLEDSPPPSVKSSNTKSFDFEGIRGQLEIDTLNEVNSEIRFFGLERENSFVSGEKMERSISTRYSESTVKTNFEDHIRFLEDQNNQIFNLVDGQMRVDQVLNGDLRPSS